ncbi:lipoprotein NlpI [Thalassomonas sp. M1454]|uniref:lipoprotein NlpI n=1 Tax=Thalassomonas sp. M1454 TaxID=2594477 RepID=UPI00117F5D68|nr:lipoprotein NlpI [Thalassomonas sp. M1454]TRX56546.1 lipoprotein NlpI [Thalassomonas sp. M1454]
MKLKLPAVSALLFLLLQGCATTNKSDPNFSNLIIAEPLPISQQSEIALARLSEILTRVEVTNEQRAKLFYDRGVIYDSVGLRGLASFDFQRAIRLQPNLVDAYNFIGIHHTQRQDFLQAYEAFDSAIELDPMHEYAYLNRGIALYYGARPRLAIDDLSHFKEAQKHDPYRIAWVYLVENDIDRVSAKAHLKSNLDAIEHNSWANNVLRLFLDEMSEQEFIAQLGVGVTSHKELTNRLCEAYFYLGKYHLLKEQPSIAADYFKLALSTNVYEFIEHRYAKLELQLLNATVGPQIN